MGKKGKGGAEEAKESKEATVEKEGYNLLGTPTFVELDNGRFKCVETGHELPAHSKESYAQSKHCRLGLIDSALAKKKPPLNMFDQDPQSRSKLICKLSGVTINKTEEHIWKHINGKRFLNLLDRVEAEQESGKTGEVENQKPEKKKKTQVDALEKKKKQKKKKEEVKDIVEVISEVRDSSDKHSGSDEEDEFWMPPVGDRWDFDDGRDKCGSSAEMEQENDDVVCNGVGTEEGENEARELAKRAKRISLEIGPSSYATRKKKKKTTQSS